MIDTSAWKEFKISDLFDVKNSKSISDKRGLDFDENNPYDFIGRTPVNNGIQGRIVKQDFEPNNENTFSVTQIGEKLCLFRDNKWYACQNIFLLTPLYPELITAKFFICCVVTKTLNAVFGEDAYSSYPTKDTLSDMMVKLPATSDGQPDWDYMESYMKAVMEESEKSLENLRKADNTKHLIDVSGWGEFRIGDLLCMEKQIELNPVEAYNNNIENDIMYPFIGQSSENNGIIDYYYLGEDLLNNKMSQFCIMIHSNTHLAYCVNTPFYLKDGHGATTIFTNEHFNEMTTYFLISVINTTMNGKFDYDMKATKEKLNDLIIKLPITSTGEPDWQYMEDYMKQIMDKSGQSISDLQKVV